MIFSAWRALRQLKGWLTTAGTRHCLEGILNEDSSSLSDCNNSNAI